MISNRPRRFGGETAIPEIWMQTVADLDFFDPINFLMQKATVTNESTDLALDHSELGWQSGLIPADYFLKEHFCLFSRHRAHREFHELLVRHELAYALQIALGKGPQNQTPSLKDHSRRGKVS